MRNYQLLLFSAFWLSIVACIGSGEYTQYFAGELNEIGCVVIALTLSLLSLLGVNWKKLGQWLISY